MMSLWLISGLYFGALVNLIVVASVYLMRTKIRYDELFFGFWFLLILADSRQLELSFAITTKAIYIVLLGLLLITDRDNFFPHNKLYQRFIPFIMLALISLVNAEGAVFSYVQRTLSYLLLLMVVPNFIARLYREDREQLFRKLMYFAVLALVVGLVLRYTYPDIVTLEGRYSGVFGNPNGMGIFCALMIFLFQVIEFVSPGIYTKRERILLYGLIAVSLFFCGSRGAMVGIGIFFLFRYFYKLSPFLGFLLFLIIAVAYQAIEANAANIVIFLGLEEYFRIETLQSGSGRIIGWNFAWQHIQDAYLFGRGLGYSGWLYTENFTTLSLMGHLGNAHNSYLTFWLDTGIFGLVAYMVAFFSLIFQAAKKFRLAMPMTYAILFMINVESWLVASLNPFTIILYTTITIMLLAYRDRRFTDMMGISDEDDDALTEPESTPVPAPA